MINRIFICKILFCLHLFAQVNQEWVAKYNGPVNSNDYSRCIVTDNAGNVYMAGSSFEGVPNDYDFLVIKYNAAGSLLWVKKINGSADNNDDALSIAVDTLGNVYACGYIRNGSYDYITVKFNSSGDTQWVRTYNGSGNSSDFAKKVAIDNNGNVIVTGYSFGVDDNEDYVTIKYNSSGDVQWLKRFNGPDNGYDIPYDLKIDNTGNIYVTGQSLSFNSDSDYLTIKYDNDGNELWNRRYNHLGNSIDNAYKMSVDNTDDVYITGGSYNSVSGFGDIVTIKYSSAGILQWTKIFNGISNDDDDGIDIMIGELNNIYVLGKSKNISTGYDVTLIKYTSNGDSLWTRLFNSSGNNDDIPAVLSVDKFNNAYVTGSNSFDFTTLKFDSLGSLVWSRFYNGTGNGIDVGNSISVDSNLNVYVSGTSVENGSNGDATTIKYSQPIGIINYNETALSFRLYQNYPNPFNPNTIISFSISTDDYVELYLYDIRGQLIAKLIDNSFIRKGYHQISFNGAKYSSGIYFIKLNTTRYSETKKMVLLK